MLDLIYIVLTLTVVEQGSVAYLISTEKQEPIVFPTSKAIEHKRVVIENGTKLIQIIKDK